jgi:hypothetical protein
MLENYPYTRSPAIFEKIELDKPAPPKLELEEEPVYKYRPLDRPDYPSCPKLLKFKEVKPQNIFPRKTFLKVTALANFFIILASSFFSVNIIVFILLILTINLANYWKYHKLYHQFSISMQKYKNKQREVEDFNSTYPEKLEQWEKERAKIDREHQDRERENREQYDRQYLEKRKKWEKQFEEKTLQHQEEKRIYPLKIIEWRRKAIQKALSQLNPCPLQNKRIRNYKEQQGYSEQFFSSFLKYYFDHTIQDSKKIDLSNSSSKKKPRASRIPIVDFAYIGKICIDIEIDEPYTERGGNGQRIPIHYPSDNQWKDDLFTEHDWFVIRFSEKQIIEQPESCCKAIAKLIADTTLDSSFLNRFINIPDVNPDPRWTEDRAKEMGKTNYRLSYRKPLVNR